MDLTKFEGHTPGPWQWTDAMMPQRLGMIVSGTRCVMAFGDDEKYEETCGTPPVDADRALVLAAPELLEEITRLRAENERLRFYAEADACCPCCGELETCFECCSFADDCPDGQDRMNAARAALYGNKADKPGEE